MQKKSNYKVEIDVEISEGPDSEYDDGYDDFVPEEEIIKNLENMINDRIYGKQVCRAIYLYNFTIKTKKAE